MNTLQRNQRKVYYKNFVSSTPITVTEGGVTYETGEHTDTYSAMKETYAYVSVSTGDVQDTPYGMAVGYDKVLIMKSTDMTESSILWVDVVPTYNEQQVLITPPDYKVYKIAKSLNFVQVAIKREQNA